MRRELLRIVPLAARPADMTQVRRHVVAVVPQLDALCKLDALAEPAVGAPVFHQHRSTRADHAVGAGRLRLAVRRSRIADCVLEQRPSLVHAPGEHEARADGGGDVQLDAALAGLDGEVAAGLAVRDRGLEPAIEHVGRGQPREQPGPDSPGGAVVRHRLQGLDRRLESARIERADRHPGGGGRPPGAGRAPRQPEDRRRSEERDGLFVAAGRRSRWRRPPPPRRPARRAAQPGLAGASDVGAVRRARSSSSSASRWADMAAARRPPSSAAAYASSWRPASSRCVDRKAASNRGSRAEASATRPWRRRRTGAGTCPYNASRISACRKSSRPSSAVSTTKYALSSSSERRRQVGVGPADDAGKQVNVERPADHGGGIGDPTCPGRESRRAQQDRLVQRFRDHRRCQGFRACGTEHREQLLHVQRHAVRTVVDGRDQVARRGKARFPGSAWSSTPSHRDRGG